MECILPDQKSMKVTICDSQNSTKFFPKIITFVRIHGRHFLNEFCLWKAFVAPKMDVSFMEAFFLVQKSLDFLISKHTFCLWKTFFFVFCLVDLFSEDDKKRKNEIEQQGSEPPKSWRSDSNSSSSSSSDEEQEVFEVPCMLWRWKAFFCLTFCGF